MGKFFKAFFFFHFFFLISLAAEAAEPPYCDLENFKKFEIQADSSGMRRLHVFKIGTITIAGLSVGLSDSESIERLAGEHSSSVASEGYCTWYLNRGNLKAAHVFNHKYVPKPVGDASQRAQQYLNKLRDQFDQASSNFVSCAENRGYIALGCNDMRHRGPTVFGMLLAYSGCAPESALKIVNNFWGANGIKDDVREAIIRKGYDLGVAHPSQSAQFRNHLLGF